MADSTFYQYMRIEGDEAERTLRAEIESGGYFAFFAFIEAFRDGLKQYADGEIETYRRKLARVRALFPSPEKFSPSWSAIWEEFDTIFRGKNEALSAIPESRRDGEWQILLDNPYSHQQVVCYPGLPFLEAAYMYGYFQRELKPNELLRMQKVTELLSVNGNKEASLLPD
ncbi:hypothetical protein ACF3MZ_09425 [Paenibacillaceae bacterium WGS1546]|uniref:hypothetical protein n=1 Tax=Cohnella sp. WGS1546 TaxID=3366810 RepID=UPI00372D7335